MAKAISCVLFDAVGTIIYPDPPVDQVYTSAGLRHGSGLRVEQIGERFRLAFAAHCDAAPTSEVRERERWRDIVAQVFSDVSEPVGLFEDLWHHFSQAEHWAIFDDVGPAWQALEALGTKVGIASNFDQRLVGICQRLSPLKRADWIFHSAGLGISKPSRKFFDAVQRQLDVPCEAILMVGDSEVNDIAPALSLGWNAIRIDRQRQSGADNVIHTLGDVAGFCVTRQKD